MSGSAISALAPADRRERRVALPLREPKLREAGLRLPAEPARLAVRLLGRVELAAQPQELGLAVVARCPPRGSCVSIEPLARAPRLLERVRPRAAELQDLRAMDEAAAGEGDEIASAASAQLGQRHASTRAPVATSKTSWHARMTPQ